MHMLTLQQHGGGLTVEVRAFRTPYLLDAAEALYLAELNSRGRASAAVRAEGWGWGT